MLNLPRLDDLDYQRLWDRARAMAPTLSPEWTDLNDHDPGVTTLQTFAWLCDSLNYYINATGEAHWLNMLKLLGIRPRRSPAQCRVEFRTRTGRPVSQLAGTRLLAGDTVFELAAPVEGRANRMTGLYNEENGKRYDLSPFVASDGGFAPILSDDPACAARACFGFERALSGEIRLFFPVAEASRNPFGPDFSLVRLSWESWDGEEWQPAEVAGDETCGLLRSGFLTLRLQSATAPLKAEGLTSLHYLRCAVASGCYDLRPRVGRAAVCCGMARQTDTQVHTVGLIYGGEPALAIGYAAGPTDRVAVAVREESEFVQWRGFSPAEDDLCTVEKGAVVFDAGRFGRLPAQGSEVLVTIARPGARLSLGETDGCASFGAALETKDLCRLRLALSHRDADGRWRFTVFDECADLAGAGFDDQVFQIDRRENRVVFGDGINGVQPESGLMVQVIEHSRSGFAQGNVLRGQVNRLEEPLEGLTVSNLEDAWGGECRCTFEELEPLLEEKLKTVTRAVTEEDIRTLVLNTPGLMIESAAVVPATECPSDEPDTPEAAILVAVRPKSERRLPTLSEDYARIIRAHLERSRMLSSELKVCSVRYVGIGVYGRIRLAEPGKPGENEVLAALQNWIETENPVFGQRVDFGRLFSRLELLPCVRAVPQLSLEYIGEGGRKSEHGDILLLADCLPYLWDTGIEFL